MEAARLQRNEQGNETESDRFSKPSSAVSFHSHRFAFQAKLTINEPGDQYEQEADRTAEQIMRMPDPTIRLQRKCGCGGSCEECASSPPLVQRWVASQAEQEPMIPGLVHEVLRSPGIALDGHTRAFFEHRFQQDLGGVRIHADTQAADSAHEVNARAYTVGRDVVFGRGEFAPNTETGRHLLAHELTHVLQQSSGSQPSRRSTDSFHETSEVSAVPARIQRTPVTFAGRTFEVGDIQLNARADVDVRSHGVLLPGPDQAHILVTNSKQLGYEVSHTTPDDPFRWNRLKELVDNGHVEINGVGSTENFPVQEVRGGTSTIVRRNLGTFLAGGITLPRLSVQQAIYPNAPLYVASANNTRDTVFYETGAGGRGTLGSNSLAHEFFGHLWLSLKGVPFKHGGQIPASANILDPMGRTFAGSVNDYIDRFAGASQTALQSPTQRVSPAHLAAALSWIQTNGASHLTWRNNAGSIDGDFSLQWEILGNNYAVLRSGPQPPAGTAGSAASVVTAVVEWFNNTLNRDQKRAFRSVLVEITTSFGVNRRRELATDVLTQLPRL